MVSKREPTIKVKNRTYKVNSVRPALLQKWKNECMIKFPVHRLFNCLMVDVPWSYRVAKYSESKTLNGLATYPCQSLQELMDMPVKKILAEPAVCFFWVTGPMLSDAFKILEAWGLTYCSIFNVWVKTYANGEPVFNPGYYSRSSVELLLIATRGKGLTKLRKRFDIRQVVQAPRLTHSEKPDIFVRIVESLFDFPAKLEMYARSIKPGWSSWGLEVSDGKNQHFYYQDPGYKDPRSTSTDSSKTLKKTGGNPENVPMDEYVIEEFKLPKQYFVEHGLTGVL